MPATRRRHDQRWIAAEVLTVYGLLLFATQARLAVFDDEATIVLRAAELPLGEMLSRILFGGATHVHGPLYDSLLAFWIQYLQGDAWPWLLRVPSILFCCLALAFTGAAAELLFGQRLAAIGIGVTWPLVYYLGLPAHHSALEMLAMALTGWCFLRWLENESWGRLGGFAASGLTLAWTNYAGGLALIGLGIYALAQSRTRRRVVQLAVAAGAVLAGFAPLVPVLLRVLSSEPAWGADADYLAVSALYHLFVLLPSEMIAPWHWPALLVAIGLAGLVFAGLTQTRLTWLLLLVGLVYVPLATLGLLTGKRLGLLVPWVILALTGLTTDRTRTSRLAAAGLALVFVMGWIGTLTRTWPATHRYQEPWQLVVEETFRLAQPGDLIVGGHPSFFFWTHYHLGWDSWQPSYPYEPFNRSGYHFAVLGDEGLEDPGGVVDVRTVAESSQPDIETAFLEKVRNRPRTSPVHRFLPDRDAALKQRFLPGQPEWRIGLWRHGDTHGGSGQGN